MRVSTAVLVAVMAMGSCRTYQACLFAHAPADATRRQRMNHVFVHLLLREPRASLAAYHARCGGYPATLEVLGDPVGGAAAPCQRSGTQREAIAQVGGPDAGRIDWRMESFVNAAAGQDREYRIQYTPRRPVGRGAFGGYVLRADPLARDVTGFYSFLMAEDGTIRGHFSRPAQETDPEW